MSRYSEKRTLKVLYLRDWRIEDLALIFANGYSCKSQVVHNFIKCARRRFHYSLKTAPYDIYVQFEKILDNWGDFRT